MTLKETITRHAEAEHAARIAAIAAGTGKITETEALAQTLRDHGIEDAIEMGFAGSTSVMCWVLIPPGITVAALRQAIASAGLLIDTITGDDGTYATVKLAGLTADLSVAAETARALREPAPAVPPAPTVAPHDTLYHEVD